MKFENSPLKYLSYNDELEKLRGEKLLKFLINENLIIKHQFNEQEEKFTNIDSFQSPFDFIKSNRHIYEFNCSSFEEKLVSGLFHCINVDNEKLTVLKAIDENYLILNQNDLTLYLENSLKSLNIKSLKYFHFTLGAYNQKTDSKYLKYSILPNTYRNHKELIRFYFKNNRSFSSIRNYLDPKIDKGVNSEIPIIIDELAQEYTLCMFFDIIYQKLSKLRFENSLKTQDVGNSEIESASDSLSTYEQIYIMDQLGMLSGLEESSRTKKHQYQLLSKILGKSSENIRKYWKELDDKNPSDGRLGTIDKLDSFIKHG